MKNQDTKDEAAAICCFAKTIDECSGEEIICLRSVSITDKTGLFSAPDCIATSRVPIGHPPDKNRMHECTFRKED